MDITVRLLAPQLFLYIFEYSMLQGTCVQTSQTLISITLGVLTSGTETLFGSYIFSTMRKKIIVFFKVAIIIYSITNHASHQCIKAHFWALLILVIFYFCGRSKPKR